MSGFSKISGTVRLKITCAEPISTVHKIVNIGISVFDISQVDMLTLIMRISAKDFRRLCVFLDRQSCQYSVVDREGGYWVFGAILGRKILIAGVLLILLAALLVPTRILFFEVVGNVSIPDSYILECAEACGISFGASRRQVRSEKMKNALLERVPELQWAGINTSGCIAIIQVREKNVTDSAEKTAGISNIVAERDGIIYSCTVEEGNVLCRVGQAVSKGQLLVSGYQDVGLLVTAKPVKAEIFALTQRVVQAVSPCLYQKREVKGSETVKYSIRIGKNIIKLYKGSGIYDATCVKMYSEEYICLPGGFQLPVAIIKERSVQYDLVEKESVDFGAHAWLEAYAENYVTQQMIAGRILYADTSVEEAGRVFMLRGQYVCIESIGKNKTEEIIDYNGKND